MASQERSEGTESEQQLESQEIAHVLEELQGLPKDEQSLDKMYEMARFSLETVTHLTEYEDEKANRVMTAVAFLSALAAVVFSAFADKFPPASLLESSRSGYHLQLILVLVYLSFATYCVMVILGAALTLNAVRPQFNIPTAWKRSHKAGPPSSFLFFDKILEAGGKNWGNAFAGTGVVELKRKYTQNCILETFLIAQKIRRKLKPLQRGIRLFWLSSFMLLVFLVASTVAMALIHVPDSYRIDIETKARSGASKTARKPTLSVPGDSENDGGIHSPSLSQTVVMSSPATLLDRNSLK